MRTPGGPGVPPVRPRELLKAGLKCERGKREQRATVVAWRRASRRSAGAADEIERPGTRGTVTRSARPCHPPECTLPVGRRSAGLRQDPPRGPRSRALCLVLVFLRARRRSLDVPRRCWRIGRLISGSTRDCRTHNEDRRGQPEQRQAPARDLRQPPDQTLLCPRAPDMQSARDIHFFIDCSREGTKQAKRSPESRGRCSAPGADERSRVAGPLRGPPFKPLTRPTTPRKWESMAKPKRRTAGKRPRPRLHRAPVQTTSEPRRLESGEDPPS